MPLKARALRTARTARTGTRATKAGRAPTIVRTATTATITPATTGTKPPLAESGFVRSAKTRDMSHMTHVPRLSIPPPRLLPHRAAGGDRDHRDPAGHPAADHLARARIRQHHQMCRQ